MKITFKVNKTYSETTPESVSEGDFSDTGFEYEDLDFSLSELIRELEEYSELSQHPVTPTDCSHVWASTEFYTSCYKTGTERMESIHIESMNGKPISSKNLYRIFRLAGLVEDIKQQPTKSGLRLV